MEANRKYNGLEIAIIGISAQFPYSGDHRRFWDNLMAGRDLITRFSTEELTGSGLSDELLSDATYIKASGTLPDKEYFDNAFFDYRREDAALMDPQTRLFHEQCWKALEDAGYAAATEKQKIGLFASASENGNWKLYVHSKMNEEVADPFYISKISSEKYMCTLVAYKLNLRGPVIYLDTACSSSLVAVNMACRSLLTRECAMALAGGISLSTNKQKGYRHEEGMTLSSDGYCRAFDASSDGTVPGEGAGVVLLKRLDEAIRDRDHIYAIIKASSVNNDGNDRLGYTAPSARHQSECIKMAFRLSGVDPRTVSYVEAHGTATRLGDPIEIKALNDAFAVGGSDKFCAIGSVKTNMGHLDVAAGIAGLIKAALCLQYKQLPPSLHFSTPNPEIDFDGGPFVVNTQSKEWIRDGAHPLRAGVSSFGIGGTNGHILLEEAPETAPGSEEIPYKLLTLSAKSEDALISYADELESFLKDRPELNLSDMVFTLQTGRKHFTYRRSLVFKDRDTLLTALEEKLRPEQLTKSMDGLSSVIFMFSGAGSQYVNMGRDLYDGIPAFRESMDNGFDLLRELTGVDYRSIFYSGSSEDTVINDILHTQPAIFIFEYALATLMISWGVRPAYMIGHSIGEYVAACISGVFSYEDALRLVVKRGELMSDIPKGAMLSVSITEEEAGQYLDEHIALAAVNSGEQVVFSGDTAAIGQLTGRLEEADISWVKLHATVAGHSHFMTDILDDYRKVLEEIPMHSPVIPFLSNLTGHFITPEAASSVEYWMQHMRHTVRFSDGIRKLLSRDEQLIFVEIGAGHSLTTLLRQQVTGKIKPIGINLVRHPKEEGDDREYLTGRLGQLWEYGAEIDWTAYDRSGVRRKLSLPAYSFQRTKFPVEVSPFGHQNLPDGNPAIGAKYSELKDWVYYPVWRSSILPADHIGNKEKTCLLFADGHLLTRHISNLLPERGTACVEVLAGNVYEKLARNKYVIDPADPLHYQWLIDAIGKDGLEIDTVLYSWGMNIDPGHIRLDIGNKEINLAYFGLVNIIKTLLDKKMLGNKQFTVLTDSLYRITGNEALSYAPSLSLGVMNALSQEYSVSSMNIDVNLQEDMEGLATLILDEIDNNGGTDRVLAFRGGQRWVQDFQRHATPLMKGDSRLKKGRTYLITGGLGNLGFILATYLISSYQARIILTGRRALDSLQEEAADRLKYLKELNNDVLYHSVDVSNLEKFRAAIGDVERVAGPVNGIIHAAGIVDMSFFELIEDTTPQKAMEIFTPKVLGIENIHQLFKEKALDFVWVASSLASVLAGVGYAAYSSANLYMDHFITSRMKGLPGWIAVDLSEMLFSEEEVRQENKHERTALRPDELCELFEWSLSLKGIPVLMETVKDLSSRIYKAYKVRQEVYLDDDLPAVITQQLGRSGLSADYVAPGTDTEMELVKILEAFFGIEGIGVDDNFFELGGDSLKAMIVLKKLKKAFDINLSIKDFFLKPSVRQIASEVDATRILLQKKERRFKKVI